MRCCVRRSGDAPADGRSTRTCSITYAELDSSTAELASGLIDAGIGKGTRVGLIMPNGADWVRIALAATRIGAVLVPLSTLLTHAN